MCHWMTNPKVGFTLEERNTFIGNFAICITGWRLSHYDGCDLPQPDAAPARRQWFIHSFLPSPRAHGNDVGGHTGGHVGAYGNTPLQNNHTPRRINHTPRQNNQPVIRRAPECGWIRRGCPPVAARHAPCRECRAGSAHGGRLHAREYRPA
ncbi:MAG: hypothetical protein BWY65_02325 [Firmicutes bacterium ADurb.Bin373]|nr:MAG: hypothetical protein BWY65_02325 [Firmicutes bacterium ADurb.Bin373]